MYDTGWVPGPRLPSPLPVWVDTDGGIDDALALLALAASPRVQLVGVSTVAGNVTAAQAAANAAAIVQHAGAAVPVYVGGSATPGRDPDCRHGVDGLGDTHLGRADLVAVGSGVDRLLIAVAGRPGALHVLGLGPATNLAAAVQQSPRLPSRLGSLTLVAGTRPGVRDTNTWCDPHAMSDVFAAFRDAGTLTAVTLEATFGSPLGGLHLDRLRPPAGHPTVWSFASFYAARQSRELGRPTLIPHDALAAAHLLGGVAAGVTAGGCVEGDLAHEDGPGTITWVRQLGPGVADQLVRLLAAP